jgi:hypothetical protein
LNFELESNKNTENSTSNIVDKQYNNKVEID